MSEKKTNEAAHSNQQEKGKQQVDSDDEIGPPLPPGFKPFASSSKGQKATSSGDSATDLIGPPIPGAGGSSQVRSSEKDSDEEEEEEDEEEEVYDS